MNMRAKATETAHLGDLPADDFYRRAMLRLIAEPRSDAILRTLASEAVHIGFPRAMVLTGDFKAGAIEVAASPGFSPQDVQFIRKSVAARSQSFASVIRKSVSTIVPNPAGLSHSIYCHPLRYQTHCECWDHVNPDDSAAFFAGNSSSPSARSAAPGKVCKHCAAPPCSALLVAELPKKHSSRFLEHADALAVMANHCLTRLLRMEHYHRRALEMDAAEKTVRQERDRLNLILENVGDPILVFDRDAKPVLLDPLAQALFGNSPDEKDPVRAKNQAALKEYLYAFTNSFGDKESQPLSFTDPATGLEIHYDTRSGKIYDDQGEVAYTVAVLRDYSFVHKLEQLKMEHRMLEIEKFATAGQLAATIAHEVNNPMEAIKNAIYLLAGMVKPEAQPIYEILKSETDRVARIVRQMLGLYRAQQPLKPVNVNDLVEDVLALLTRQLQRSHINVVLELGDLPKAVLAADQLRQVFSNLIINAKDSMPGGGELRLRTRYIPRGANSPGSIRILIADNGTGIPRHLQASIFEPFVTTKGQKGTGLGLWIVKDIINNHGGTIRVRSRQHAGTVFNIELAVVR